MPQCHRCAHGGRKGRLPAFLQDTYALIPKALDLTLGTKFEHNDYTGFEVQPSAKLAWYPTANQTVWASVARAVRTPSRGDDGILLNAFAVPSQGVIVQQVGNPSFESEELTAYELGYRIRPTAKTSVDVSGFINDYDKLRTAEFLPVQITPQGAFLPVTPGNLGEGQTYGTEVSGTWDVTTRWSLKANYTYMTLDLRNKPDSTDITLAQEKDKIPHHQFNIRSQLYLTDAIDSTTTLYYVDQVPLYNVSDYVRLDTRIGWKVDDGIDLSLVGQNLLESSHQEFGAPLQGVANKIGREFYVKATFRY